MKNEWTHNIQCFISATATASNIGTHEFYPSQTMRQTHVRQSTLLRFFNETKRVIDDNQRSESISVWCVFMLLLLWLLSFLEWKDIVRAQVQKPKSITMLSEPTMKTFFFLYVSNRCSDFILNQKQSSISIAYKELNRTKKSRHRYEL